MAIIPYVACPQLRVEVAVDRGRRAHRAGREPARPVLLRRLAIVSFLLDVVIDGSLVA
jgi:hypothetical protein